MKRFAGYLFIIFLIASCKPYSINNNTITLRVKDTTSNFTQVIKVEVIADNIIHVQSSPNRSIDDKKSLIICKENLSKGVEWEYIDKNGDILVKTSKLQLNISKATGKLTFLDKNGNTKLQEKDGKSSYFTSKEIDGKTYYSVRQVFNSPSNEAFYGLGQHQNGQVNYKGEDVDLFQHNLVAVVPFLVSNNDYGILWDNYSRSKFGDPRDYQPLTIFNVYDENGNEGGLTAKYYTKRDKKELLAERLESEIQYKYITDLNKFPKDFNPGEGMVEWTGYIEAKEIGSYKFLSHSAGYIKIWLDEELVVDNWRQCWNAWTKKFKLNATPGRKIPLHIEWIPDGGESYIALECLSPYPENEQNELSLYSEVAKGIDYYYISGENADEIISGYRLLTGKAPIMPKWAMGLWQSRERYQTQDELLNVVKEYRKRQIPLDNIVLDWHYWEEDKWGEHSFDHSRFPDPVGMVKELHNNLHANIMISVWPKYYENTRNYEIMRKNGWLYMENINNRQKDWVGPGYISTFYDAFNEEAREAYWSQLRDSLYVKGIDAWWLDATEPDVKSNTSQEEREKLMSPTALGPAAEYLNAYSLMQSKGVYEGQRSVDPNKRVFILTRSAFAGQQKYATATWSGDVASRWSDLKDQIAAGVNFCISGIPYWTTDIGGFSMESRYYNPTKDDLNEWRELNLRWFQFGVFCPLFRIHGQYPYREIYNLSPEGSPVYNSMVFYDKLRYQLMPYIYSLAGATYHNDYTIMRPLMMDHAADINVLNINDQFMFGSDLLVCPVYQYKATNRKVYLPNTSGWYDLLSGEYYEGGRNYTVNTPLNKIPVFVKEGAIIACGPEIHYINEKLTDPVTICVFAGKDGSFTLYEDEGTNYDYEQGLYSKIKFNYSESDRMLSIDKQEGHFPGMLKERTFNVKLITKDTKQGLMDMPEKTYSIDYDGKPISIKL
ncbi:MAG: DUF5110 domain-containing protein [Bacteroidales bacterium]|nr:DUF5110 domain-containing protein [Bacteroidales bacterium]